MVPTPTQVRRVHWREVGKKVLSFLFRQWSCPKGRDRKGKLVHCPQHPWLFGPTVPREGKAKVIVLVDDVIQPNGELIALWVIPSSSIEF